MVRVSIPASTGMELGSIMRVRLVEAGAAGMLTGFVADDGDVSPPDEDMAGGDWQPVRTQATNNIAANHFFISVARDKISRSNGFEARAVVRFKPVERAEIGRAHV